MTDEGRNIISNYVPSFIFTYVRVGIVNTNYYTDPT